MLHPLWALMLPNIHTPIAHTAYIPTSTAHWNNSTVCWYQISTGNVTCDVIRALDIKSELNSTLHTELRTLTVLHTKRHYECDTNTIFIVPSLSPRNNSTSYFSCNSLATWLWLDKVCMKERGLMEFERMDGRLPWKLESSSNLPVCDC